MKNSSVDILLSMSEQEKLEIFSKLSIIEIAKLLIAIDGIGKHE